MATASKEPKPHRHATLIMEFARQVATGERHAGWWNWYVKDETNTYVIILMPMWNPTAEYSYSKSTSHPDIRRG